MAHFSHEFLGHPYTFNYVAMTLYRKSEIYRFNACLLFDALALWSWFLRGEHESIADMISSHHGYLHERAGFIIGFFDDPDGVIRCAECMRQSFGLDVEVNGCQLTFVDRRRNTEDYPLGQDEGKLKAGFYHHVPVWTTVTRQC